MRVTEIHNVRESDYEDDGKGSIEVTVQLDDGTEKSVYICAGEPEDAVFFRDLEGAYYIADLVALAYEAGKRGEEMIYEFVDESDDGKNDDGDYLCDTDICTQCDTVCLMVDGDYGN